MINDFIDNCRTHEGAIQHDDLFSPWVQSYNVIYPIFISALDQGYIDTARYMLLIINAVRVDQVNNRYKDTPLFMFASRGNYQAVKLLLESGANPTIGGNREKMEISPMNLPLHHALCNNHLDVALLLLQSGATYDYDELRRESLLDVEGVVGDLDITKLTNLVKLSYLERSKANVNQDFDNEFIKKLNRSVQRIQWFSGDNKEGVIDTLKSYCRHMKQHFPVKAKLDKFREEIISYIATYQEGDPQSDIASLNAQIAEIDFMLKNRHMIAYEDLVNNINHEDFYQMIQNLDANSQMVGDFIMIVEILNSRKELDHQTRITSYNLLAKYQDSASESKDEGEESYLTEVRDALDKLEEGLKHKYQEIQFESGVIYRGYGDPTILPLSEIDGRFLSKEGKEIEDIDMRNEQVIDQAIAISQVSLAMEDIAASKDWSSRVRTATATETKGR